MHIRENNLAVYISFNFTKIYFVCFFSIFLGLIWYLQLITGFRNTYVSGSSFYLYNLELNENRGSRKKLKVFVAD